MQQRNTYLQKTFLHNHQVCKRKLIRCQQFLLRKDKGTILPPLLEGYILPSSIAQIYKHQKMRITKVLFASLSDQKHLQRCPKPDARTSLLIECSTCQPRHPLTQQVISTSGAKKSREDTSSVSFLFNGKLELYLPSEVITHCINNCEEWYVDHRWQSRMVQVLFDVGRSLSHLPAWHKRLF